MKHPHIVSIAACAAALAVAVSLAPMAAGGQGRGNLIPAGGKLRGGAFPRQLTLFDRQGNVVRAVGEPDLYQQPMFSPDGTRLAVVRQDQQTRTQDLWVFDLPKGTKSRFTSEPAVDSAPVWSSDGSQIAYFSFRGNYGGFYRKASDGTGSEETLYREIRITNNLTDWSPDGRFLAFSQGGVLWLLTMNGEHKPIELLRDEFSAMGSRFSPDGRFLAYRSDESGRNEIYVRPFDPSAAFATGGEKWQVSDKGGLGMIHWRRDGKELYYLAADGGVMAVDVTTAPAFKPGPPKFLFLAPSAIPRTGTPEGLATISPDGQQVLFSVPTPPQRVEVTVAPEILAKYAGTYVGPGNADVVVTLEGDQLMIQPAPGQGTFLLYASSETSFFFKAAEPEIEFVKDDKGNVTHFMLYQGIRATKAIRK